MNEYNMVDVRSRQHIVGWMQDHPISAPGSRTPYTERRIHKKTTFPKSVPFVAQCLAPRIAWFAPAFRFSQPFPSKCRERSARIPANRRERPGEEAKQGAGSRRRVRTVRIHVYARCVPCIFSVHHWKALKFYCKVIIKMYILYKVH